MKNEVESRLTKIEVQEIVKNKFVRKDFLNRHLGSTSYHEYENVENSKFKTKEQTYNIKIYKSKTKYILIITITSFFLLTFPYLNRENSTSFLLKVFYFITFLVIVFCLNKIFSSKKLYIQVLQNSFIFNKREVFWDEIMTIGKLIVSTQVSHNYLILGLNSGEILQIDIDKSEIHTEDFIKIIHLNKL